MIKKLLNILDQLLEVMALALKNLAEDMKSYNNRAYRISTYLPVEQDLILLKRRLDKEGLKEEAQLLQMCIYRLFKIIN